MQIERIVPEMSLTPGNQTRQGEGFGEMINQGINELNQ